MPDSVQHSPDQAPVAIVTDASVDVPEVERLGASWVMLPEEWRGRGLVLPDVSEQSRQLVRLALSGAATVHAPSQEQFERAFDDLIDGGAQRIWSLHGASELCGSIDAARAAARGRTQVEVVEASVASFGVGLLARRVLQLAADGHTIDALDAYVARQAPSMRMLVVPDHFDPAGGRRTVAERLLAGRPMLSARDGQFARSHRLRSRRAAVAAIEQFIIQHAPEDGTMHMAIGHGDAGGALDPFLDIIERLRPAARIDLVGRIGPRMVRSVGARCVGMAWIAE